MRRSHYHHYNYDDAPTKWTSLESYKFFASNGKTYDNFGSTISMHGSVAAVSALSRNRGNMVYVYRYGSGVWSQTSVLHSPQSNDYFGWTLSVHNASLAIGAYMTIGDTTSVGAVYAYEHNGASWSLSSVLTASSTASSYSEAAPYNYFGWAVKQHHDAMLVGAYGDDDGGSSAGAVYAFMKYDLWTQTQKLIPSDASQQSSFGWCLDVYGNTSVIGAYGDSSMGENIGAAYLYHRRYELWSEVAKLTPRDGRSNDYFGWDVAIYNHHVVVSSHNVQSSSDKGAVYTYLYHSNRVAPLSKLTSEDAGARYFGNTVSLYDDYLVVGAFASRSDMATEAGTAYVYKWEHNYHWTRAEELRANTSEQYIDFGTSTSIYGNMILVGAVSADGAASDSGAVFYFRRMLDRESMGFPVDDTTYYALVTFLPLFIGIVLGIFALSAYILRRSGRLDDDEMVSISDDSSRSVTKLLKTVR